MKKLSRCAIALIAILSFLAFLEIKETVTGDKSIFFVRWLFSNREYAKKIEVRTYLLNDEQVVDLLVYPEKDIQQPPQKDLYLKNANVVLRMKNHGDTVAWGTLAWRLGDQQWQKIDISNLPPLHAKHAKRFNDFIIPVGVVVLLDNDLPPEAIEFKWKDLYAY